MILLGILVSIWLTYNAAKAYQLHRFNTYLGNNLYNVNIYESYMSLLRAPAWDYNFKGMLIYDV